MWTYRTRRGQEAPNARLSSSDRHLIRQRRQEGETYAEIAKRLGVNPSTVRRVDQGLTYAEEDDEG